MHNPEGTKRTMLLRVKLHSIGNSKKIPTRAVTTECSEDLVTASSTILDSPELEAIRAFDGTVRQWLYANCLPYEAGLQMIQVDQVGRVSDKLKEFSAERQELVNRLLNVYDYRVRESRERRALVTSDSLRAALTDPNRYLTSDQVARRFSMTWYFPSSDAAGDLEHLNPAMFQEERDKIAAKMQDAYAEAERLLFDTLAHAVSHLRERLEPGQDGKRKVLHETALTNLTDFLATVPFRNINNTRELDDLRSQLTGLVGGLSVDALKTSQGLRDHVAEELGKIEQAISQQISTVARRPIFTGEIETAA